jgi:hypothetical protein
MTTKKIHVRWQIPEDQNMVAMSGAIWITLCPSPVEATDVLGLVCADLRAEVNASTRVSAVSQGTADRVSNKCATSCWTMPCR